MTERHGPPTPVLWVVLGCDSKGVTEEARGPDPDALANAWAAAAQQEADRWPELGLVYMLVRRSR